MGEAPLHSPARLVVSAADAGVRLDVYVARHHPDLSRSRVQRLIADGHITVAGSLAKSSRPVDVGDVVEVCVPKAAPATPAAEALPLSILYEDADIVVIDKPAGMVVHPAAGHADGTLVNALLHHVKGLSGIGGTERPGIVHRLDRGTSGLMVVAKHDQAHRALARQFHDRLVTKEYLALVWGDLAPGGTIASAIGRDPRHRLRMSSRASRGRPASTRVVEAERVGAVTLVRVQIGTGRTHQIRVHLSEAGHPIVGDELYGGARRRVAPAAAATTRLTRPFLHAARLAFLHPVSHAPLDIEAPLPADLASLLTTLRRARPISPREPVE